MRKILLTILSLLPVFAWADTVEIAGAEISYKYVGGRSYEVNLTIYTRCNRYTLDQVAITTSSPDKNFISITKLSKPVDMGTLVMDCHADHHHTTTCEDTNSIFLGIRKWAATATFNLSNVPKTCKFIFSYQGCCRTELITTGAAGEPFYIEAYMNICDGDRNSSPQFTAGYQPYLGEGGCLVKMNTAAGSIGSNLTYNYNLRNPGWDKNNSSTYSSPYTFLEPLTHAGGFGFPGYDLNSGCWGFDIDSATGDLNLKPEKHDEVTPVAITLSSSLNGKVISSIARDLTYMVIPYNANRTPIITGIDCQKPDTITFLPGQSKCFTVCSFDPDIDDSVKLSGDFSSMSGASFLVEEGKKWPKAQFCWAPQKIDERPEPYILTVSANDNHPCDEMLGFTWNTRSTEKEILIFVGQHSGISESAQERLVLYPLPATETVSANIPETSIRKIELINMTGRKISPTYYFSGSRLSVNLLAVHSGTYILRVYTDRNIYSGMVIIAR